ncbi:hypothetical protein Btru_073138 [Bulinus truncatus]|nr:hypothetical protein Btru_073138 [Bulinus truncatus]
MKLLSPPVVLLVNFCLCVLFCVVESKKNRSEIVGGITYHDLTKLDETQTLDFYKALKVAINHMNEVKTNKGLNGETPLELVELQSPVGTQVVAGTNYYLKFTVNDGGKNITCKVVVSHLYPWQEDGGQYKLKSTSAEDECSKYIASRQARSVPLLGGKKPLDKSDKQLIEAAKWAVKHINRRSNSLYQKAMVNIRNATKQVVNGYHYEFIVTVTPTVCRNNEDNIKKTLNECPVSNEAKLEECDVSVMFIAGKYQMNSFTCKRIPDASVIGGDGHDDKPHGVIGGGDHDYKPHGVIGGRDHDYKPHGVIGGGDHDYKPHVHHMTIQDNIASPDDSCSQYRFDFEQFKTTYNKLYSSEAEESARFQVFCKNMERVNTLRKTEQGSGQYGATIFADISEEEFKKQYLGLIPNKVTTQWPKAKIPTDPIPDAWDWRDHGAVSPVKNQGSCGSCWAFSTTGNIEGQFAVNGQSHQLLSLSEQELVDCDKLDQGCGGGYMYQAYEAIMNIGGIETEDDYKYEGKDDKCRFNKSKVAVAITGAVNISQDENEMASWLYKNGPISIGINAFAMQFYMGGISHPWKLFCSPDGLDHGVLIVGYGKKGNEPYWIVKNSWGPRWGVKGYYLVYRGDGTCGVNKMCSSATVN